MKQDPMISNTIRRGLYTDNLQGTDNIQKGLMLQYWVAQYIFAGTHSFLRE